MQGVSSIVNVVCSYHLLGIKSEGKAQLLVQAAFTADLRHIWQRAWGKAPSSTSGYGEGSQLFCGLRNLLVAFTTIAEKQRVLDAKSAFRYSPQGFEDTRAKVEVMFDRFDHAVACTAKFKVCFRLAAMSDDQKIDWVEKMAGKSGVPWLRTARTAPGTGLTVDDFQTALDFWSGQVPLDEMATYSGGGAHEGTLHAVQFSGPCWNCGQHGHRQNACPRRSPLVVDDATFAGAPQPMARRGAPPLHPFGGQTPRSLHAMLHDLNLEYAARVADAQHYYAGVPGGLVQPPVTVPELEMQPQTQGGLHRLHGAALEMQPPPQAGLHLLHTAPVLHPGPLPMALPSIVGDRYRAQQASLAAEQDPHATDFEGERYYWN